MKPKKGHIVYGKRAFHQDATEAMAGDITRAIIETLTNSDDSYGNTHGRVKIEVEHRRGPWKVITRDRAAGMTTNKMEDAIIKIGEQTSGYESGADVRGNLGRGAKDLAAFGEVHFESICEGNYALLELNQYGDYILHPARKATADDREKLGIKSTGTVVTILVKESTRCPQHARLAERLSKHYQLRDIMADTHRVVILTDINSGKSGTLKYSYPDLPIVYQADLTIEGYPDATAKLTIYRNPERYNDLPSDTGRPGGILIKGRRAIYENTYFKFESNPFAGWFSGRLECPYVDQIAAEYDRKLLNAEPHDKTNPIPIITRRRDGLQKSHPFYKALATAVEAPLYELIAAEENKSKDSKSTESLQLRRTLANLSRDISKLIDDDLKEIDEDSVIGPTPSDLLLRPVRIIPEDIVLYLGQDKTVTVAVDSKLSLNEIKAFCDPEGVVEIVGDNPILLSAHRRRADLNVAQIHLRPMTEEQTILNVECNGHSAMAMIEVRSDRYEPEDEFTPVDQFQFERESYRIAWTRRKNLTIMTPSSDISKYGDMASISSSDSGVVVRTDKVKLRLDEKFGHYLADVNVEARTLGSHAILTAKLGDLMTTSKVRVTKEDSPVIGIRIDDEEAGNYRAVMEINGAETLIRIMGQHPVMKRYRGPAPDFPGDDRPMTRVVIAEIVADTVARWIMEKKFPSSLNEMIDAPRLYAEHNAYMSKYLPRCHRVCLSDIQLDGLTSI